VRLEGLGQLKKSTPSELDPATFRLVSQCLDQLRCRVLPIAAEILSLKKIDITLYSDTMHVIGEV
jgi:hypothetical protein